MDVGRRILRLSRSRGRIRRARVVGERSERDVSGVAPGRTVGREAASNARCGRGLVIGPIEEIGGFVRGLPRSTASCGH